MHTLADSQLQIADARIGRVKLSRSPKSPPAGRPTVVALVAFGAVTLGPIGWVALGMWIMS